jgi:hypothetical protein
LIGIKSPEPKGGLDICRQFVSRRSSYVTDFTKKDPNTMARTSGDAISAVKMSKRLTADVDAWAQAHNMVRSDAIRQLVELGLSTTVDSFGSALRDSVEIEDLAVNQIGQLLDPSLPVAERERRVRRLTEGPPEFLDERIDLPRSKK